LRVAADTLNANLLRRRRAILHGDFAADDKRIHIPLRSGANDKQSESREQTNDDARA